MDVSPLAIGPILIWVMFPTCWTENGAKLLDTDWPRFTNAQPFFDLQTFLKRKIIHFSFGIKMKIVKNKYQD